MEEVEGWRKGVEAGVVRGGGEEGGGGGGGGVGGRGEEGGGGVRGGGLTVKTGGAEDEGVCSVCEELYP